MGGTSRTGAATAWDTTGAIATRGEAASAVSVKRGTGAIADGVSTAIKGATSGAEWTTAFAFFEPSRVVAEGAATSALGLRRTRMDLSPPGPSAC